jgi:ribosomal protein L29
MSEEDLQQRLAELRNNIANLKNNMATLREQTGDAASDHRHGKCLGQEIF